MIFAARAALSLAFLAAALYGGWEVRRWRTPEGKGQLTRRQRRLRSWGLFFLLLALGLCLGGSFLPTPQTKQAIFHEMLYWTVTIIVFVPLIPLALLDVQENLRQTIEDRRRLRETIFKSSTNGDQT